MFQQLLNKMGLQQQKFYIIMCILAILTDSLARAQVTVEPNTAVLNEGDPTELLCRYAHHTITYCRIEIPGESKIFNLSPEWNKTPGFTYFGKGLQAGECGVSIQRVKALNNGQVKCNLGVEGEELSGTIDLVVALRPKQPLVELITKPDREGYFNAHSNFQARCIVPEGRPAANITWLIDNQPADKRVGPLDVTSNNPNGLELSTTIQEIQWTLTPEDNGRKLVCRSHHQTDRENLPPQEGSFNLLVRYSPIQQEETLVYGLYLDQTVTVNLTIRSNPAPIVEWTIDGNVIRQGEQDGRFSVFEPVYLGQDMYNVTLIIAGLTLEDTTKTYNLRASNALGYADYTVRISSSATPPASGLEIGAIVGIVVAVAILVLIVLLVLFARATGRWCFGGKSVKMSTNETGDNQQHGQSVALLETPNGVTIIGNKPSNGNATLTNYNHDHEQNEVERRNLRNSENEDDSFEYGTDRESSVYNPTTMPLRSVMAQAGGRNSQKNTDAENAHDQSDLLTKGNQLGIPESRFSRWIPKDQREILEKQAKIMAERMKPKTPEPKRIAETPEETTTPKTQSPTISRINANQTPASTTAGQMKQNNVPTETEI
ncbi:fasciclin-3 isoform X1 [Lucilia cuprina]|uniref:fasciclin-3 isoform X1 n=1 Tax=Lucilia cuprina TaxID=7375 RepID=UPI001F05EA2C|nr:fasciclin-3 isoform X1 [Lucilia cuprina]